VYDNIKRFVTYILASNIPEIIPFLLFVIAKVPLPLTVMQILAVDLGTDLLPALALGTEKPEPGIMNRPPRSRKERLLSAKLLGRAYGFLGMIEAVTSISAFFFVYWMAGWRPSMGVAAMASAGAVYVMATTACHHTIVTSQIGNGFACRTERESIFKVGFTSNRFYLWGILSELLILVMFLYVPPFPGFFGFEPVSIWVWLFMFAMIPAPLVADELRKVVVRWWARRKESVEGPTMEEQPLRDG
jgi:magnesium-transporting ATPase (P-type)